MATEREITEPVDLCRPDGRLDPAAVGWTRRPLHRGNLRGWGRRKRWEYWGIVTPEHIVGIVASTLDYAGVHGIYVLDRETGEETTRDATVPFGRGAVMGERSGEGVNEVRGGGIEIVLSNDASGTVIEARAAGVRLSVRAELPRGHESLGVVVPWSTRRFQYTVKDVGRPASGTLILGAREYVFDGAFAVLDHGRGKWPYAISWNWAAGYKPGLGVQFGGKWTEGTGSTENALIVDGRVHKISDELQWDYDRENWSRPWHITGERVDAEFRPFHTRTAKTDLLVLANDVHQCFGTFHGRARTDDGRRLDLDGAVGWAEETRNRW
ncbi:DUF2804 domain-containing protein [Nocardia flavorosea]|uniref:DUF2804 domain-containing protein n=1 Tax=Nocardia flavorosea TaxID=53429 RepID=A0A846YHH3_9NOCA|nr:DUF2804 domain-containing protein [Nocardia flavorosea]NKY58265.1 DUF2804 domain-containing protein [Nocardia flavorosea]